MLESTMGIFDSLKGVFGNKTNMYNADSDSYLVNAYACLKEAHDFLSKFLDSTKDFQPARRHEQIYNENVKGKLVLIKAWLSKGTYFLDDKLKNSMNTVSSIKNPQHLSQLVDSWIKVLKAEEKKQQEFDNKELLTTYASNSKEYNEERTEEINDIIGILRVEMWGSDRVKRGFPVPSNKEMLIGMLENATNKLREAKEHLNNYGISSSSTDLS